jgi:hypothetical protein
MTINFKDPQLQRSRQKLLALGPESRAILNMASATSAFAERDAMKNLRLQSIATDLKSRRNSLSNKKAGLAQQVFSNKVNETSANRDLQFGKDEFKFGKKQGKRATILAGLGILPKAYTGYLNYKTSGQTAKDAIKLAQSIGKSTSGVK